MKKQRLEEKLCKMKNFIQKMITPLDEKYQRCYTCSGYEKTKFCYVEPMKNEKK